MTDTFIFVLLSHKEKQRPKSHPGKDPNYLKIQETGEGVNKENIR